MLAPRTIVAILRLVLIVGVLGLLVILLGPFQGAERLVGLNDKQAHAAAFACLTVAAFVSFPYLRRWDMILGLIALGGAIEIFQAFAGRDGDLGDLFADAAGCAAVYFPSQIETLRRLSRGEHGRGGVAASGPRKRRGSPSAPGAAPASRVKPSVRIDSARRGQIG